MKPIIQKLWMVLATLCLSISASAYDFEVDGFYYEVNLEKMTATLVAGENTQVGDIVIPEKVSYKGRDFDVTDIKGAFAGNTSLTGVVVTQSITSLGDNAFEGCSSLTSVLGMENITEIGASCFKGCISLTSITLPIHLKSINNEAFANCTALSQVDIPQDVRSIGSGAFRGCKSISSIILPKSLTSLAPDLFNGCECISHIDIPISTKSICDGAFNGCKSLTDISIPSAVESIGNGVFMGCSNLSNIVFEPGSTTLKIGYNKYTQWNGTYYAPLFEECKIIKAEIGRNISSSGGTGWGCFAKTGLQTVIFQKSVTYLEEGAFLECANLTEISIPNSISSIGEWAFYNSGLKHIIFEDGYDNISFSLCVGSWDYETPHTFKNCKIEDVYVGRTLSITGGAQNPGYGGNPSTFFPTTLKHLTVGEYVKNIDVILMNNQKVTSSLSHYSNLETAQFGTNLAKIPSLIDNSRLTELSTSATTPPAANPFSNSQYMDLSVNIPEGSLEAYKSAPIWSNFWTFNESADLLHCIESEGLLYRILSDNEVEVIKKDSDYSGDIIVPSSIEYSNTIYKVTSIGEAFKGCSNLISISVPSTVLSLDNNCFADCNKLQQVDLNSNLETVPFAAFKNCAKLSQIQLPSTVSLISGCAFKGCSSLESFTCPESLSSIEESAFEDCGAITSFSFINVSSIGQSAFKGCGQLKSVELNNNISVIPAECFSGCVNLENLNDLRSIIRIENNAFENCKLIKSFELPSIISIDDYAFMDCYASNSFILGDGLKTLGDGVFYYCHSLEAIIIPGNVESIGTSVFSGTALKDLTFNDGTSILHLPVGAYDGTTSIQKKDVNGRTIQFKIQYYESAFNGLSIEKLYIGRNLSDSPRFTITGNGGVDYYLITSYDAPFNNLPKLKELTIGESVDVLGSNEKFIPEVEMYVTPGSFKKCSSLQKVNVKNTIPPTGVEFSNTAYSKAMLVVPDNSISLYEVAEGWKEFLTILDETSAGIDEVSTGERDENILVNSEGITYIGNSIENVSVYGIDGRLIHSTIVDPNKSIALSNGLYIIKIKNKSFKVKI